MASPVSVRTSTYIFSAAALACVLIGVAAAASWLTPGHFGWRALSPLELAEAEGGFLGSAIVLLFVVWGLRRMEKWAAVLALIYITGAVMLTHVLFPPVTPGRDWLTLLLPLVVAVQLLPSWHLMSWGSLFNGTRHHA